MPAFLRKGLSVILLLLAQLACGQNQGNVWYFGNGSGLDFNQSPPANLTNNPANKGGESSSMLCNADGELLMLSYGKKVYNKQGQVMPNGNNLMGDRSSIMAAYFVPQPESHRYVYLFTTDAWEDDLANGLRYTVIDLCRDQGRGAVVPAQKNQLLLPRASEKIAVARHANNRDYWVLSHKYGTNEFHAFRLTPNGIKDTVTSATGTVHTDDNNQPAGALGQMKVSPNSKHIGIAGSNGNNLTELYDFNPATGKVSNPIKLKVDGQSLRTTGVAFSPDNTKVYFIQFFRDLLPTFELVQYNLEAGSASAIEASRTVIKRVSSQNIASGFGLSLAPNGKIYKGDWKNDFKLGVINKPNKPDSLADYEPGVIQVVGETRSSLPNYINPFKDSIQFDPAKTAIETVDTPSLKKVSVQKTSKTNGRILIEIGSGAGVPLGGRFLLERKSGEGDFQVIDTISRRTYQDEDRNTLNQTHTYRVSYQNACLRGGISEPSGSHTTILLRAEGVESANKLRWQPYKGTGVKAYVVLREGVPIDTVAADSLQYRDGGVACGQTFRYQVQALLDSGIVALSNSDTAAASAAQKPSAVKLTRVSMDTFQNRAKVIWEAAGDTAIKGYRVKRQSPSKPGYQTLAVVKDPTRTRYVDSTGDFSKPLRYQVQVLDKCGNAGVPSNPGTVIPLRGSLVGEQAGQISWQPYQNWASGVTKYKVFRRNASGRYEMIGEVQPGQALTFKDEPKGFGGAALCYFVKAVGSKPGQFSLSNQVCLTPQPLVHIPNAFSPFSSPGDNDQFGPKGAFFEGYKMTIYNRWGEAVYQTRDGQPWEGSSDGEPVPVGVYFYQIRVLQEGRLHGTYHGTVQVIR